MRIIDGSPVVFWIDDECVAKFFHFTRKIVKILKANSLAMVSLPAQKQLEECMEIVQAWHPVHDSVWGMMDRIKVCIEQSPDEIVQSMFYNGWVSDHYITAVWCFVPEGTMIAAISNISGSFCYTTVAEWRRDLHKA